MPLANINGIRLFYEINGSGYPLVFCHEFAGDYRSWDLQVGYFSRSYNVITYCARGYPPSDVPDAVVDYSQEQSVEDLKDLLVYLDVDRTHIVGLSMGGNIALNFALTYPEMVSSMVLAGTGTGSDEPDAFRKRVLKMSDGMRKGGMDSMAKYVYGPVRVQLQEKAPKAFNLFREQFMEHSPIGSANTFEGVLSKRSSIFELGDRLKLIEIPTLIMTGDEDDPCINPSLFMKKNISYSGLIVFPKSGHAINLENPDLFNDSINEFLNLVEKGKWGLRDFGDGAGSLT